MRLLLRITLLGLLSGVSQQLARAQQAPPAPAAADIPELTAYVPDSLALIKGFGLAFITEPTGQTHRVYVPAQRIGFVGMLPFYRREEDIRRVGDPWSISVDKVQKMRLHDIYYEHMVVKGKRKHLLAARLANGLVELFNYTEVTQIMPGGLVGAALAAAVLGGTAGQGIVDRRWFVRRNGELTQVRRDDFMAQMSAYFQDDPETVAALAQQRVHYPDMLAIVQAYNQHRGRTN